MADPLLTTLCSICHVSPPKYKCPRCGFRTCSLPCTKKHKAWSECSGARDPTKYVPRARLRTAAGVDHDYNFLYGLERSVERAEGVVVRERALVREEELRPLTVQEVRWKPAHPGGRGGRGGPRGGRGGGHMRKVVVTRVLREAKGRVFERFLAQRLGRLNIRILCAPLGMARQKENHTTLNRRTGRINWQVEWLVFGDKNEDAVPNTTRALSKVMDDVPLYLAYQTLLDEQKGIAHRQQQKATRGRLGTESQDVSTATWHATLSTSQDPFTGGWVQHVGAEVDMWPSKRDEALRRQFRFLLGRSHTRPDRPAAVTQLHSGECLRNILTNTSVLEFPTIYVLRGGQALPKGFVLGPKDSIPAQGTKRKGGPDKNTPRGAKRTRQGGREVEEGEIGSEDEDQNLDGEVSGSKDSVGLEPGEVIDEQSFGEEDDEESDESTSSSGTSSDSE